MQAQITITIDGIISDVNQTAQQLLRVGPQMVGQHIRCLVGDSAQATQTVKNILSGKLPPKSKIGINLPDGRFFEMLMSVSLNTKNNGTIQSVSLSLHPCASNQAELHSGIIKGATDAIFSIDLQGTIISWNAASTALFGRSEPDALGTNISVLLGCEPSDVGNLVRAVTTAPRINQVELKRDVNGHARFVTIEFSKVLGASDQVLGISGVCRDVTQEKMQIANIANEVKTIVQTNKLLTEHASDLSRQAAQMELFAEMAGLLQVCEREEEVFFLISRMAAKLFPGSDGQLFNASEGKQQLSTIAHWAYASQQAFARKDCYASHRAESHISAINAPDDLRCGHLKDRRDGTYLCTPLLMRGELIGVMSIHWGAETIVADSTALSTRLLGDAALAMANLRLKKELQDMAIKDVLTGLYNRRYMEEFLLREIVRCMLKRLPLSLILFDVDHFKKFNDQNGHHAGDAVLREVGKLTQRMVRASDIGCRYGGEEFLIILPEVEIDSAIGHAEHIRRECEQMKVSYNDKVLPQVTLSLGVAAFPSHGDSGEKLIAQADAALYSAKRLGRNRAVIAAPDELNDDWVEPTVAH